MNWDWKKWIVAALVRALKTFAQSTVGVIGASAMISTVDWKTVLSTAVLSAIMSLLTSVAGLPEVREE